VRAEVAWEGGRREEALTLLDQARYWTTDSRMTEHGDSPFFNQLHERFARAELLYERGRHEDALPWYRALSYDFLYTGPAHLRLAPDLRAPGRATEGHGALFPLPGAVAELRSGAPAAGPAGAGSAGSASVNRAPNSSGMG
jgi:Tetratricopeptide repeat